MIYLLVKSRVDGYYRNGVFVSGYDRPANDSIGHQQEVVVNPEVFNWLGIKHLPVYADYAKIAQKHPEYFQSAADAKLHVQWVMDYPEISIPATDNSLTMLIRKGDKEKCVVIRLSKKKGSNGYSVRSAYVLVDGQFDKYIKAVNDNGGEIKSREDLHKSIALKSHGAGSLSPVVLHSPLSYKGSTSRSLLTPHDVAQPCNINLVDVFKTVKNQYTDRKIVFLIKAVV